MCERYVLPGQIVAEREFLPGTAWWQFAPKYNVAPAQYVPAVRVHDGQSEGVMLRWGLIPAWFEGQPSGTPNSAVRSDALEPSKTYRLPWLGSQRCILPAAGYYTWKLTAEGYRRPYFVHLAQRSVFGIAALWDRWVSEEDDVIEGCSAITVPANALLEPFTRPGLGMPAILRRRDYATWLHGTPVAAMPLLQPYDPRWMMVHPVSPRINSTDADDASLIRSAG